MALQRWQKMARREARGSSRGRRRHLRAAVGGPPVAGEPEKTDILLEAPQLKVKALALEIENLELANLLRIGKVRLQVEHLDAELYVQTHLGDLLHAVNRLVSTLNPGLGLFFTPVHHFNAAAAAWGDYLEFTRRCFELPLKLSVKGP